MPGTSPGMTVRVRDRAFPPYPNRASNKCLCIFPDVLRGSASIATKCTSLGSL